MSRFLWNPVTLRESGGETGDSEAVFAGETAISQPQKSYCLLMAKGRSSYGVLEIKSQREGELNSCHGN